VCSSDLFDRPFAEAVAIEYPSFVKRCKEVLHEYNDTDNDPKIIMSRSEEFWKFNYHDFLEWRSYSATHGPAQAPPLVLSASSQGSNIPLPSNS
jgi:hypothetical protein